MHSDRAYVASRVRAEMARARLSGRALADRLGWRVDVLARRLREDAPFTGDQLMAIARELGISAEVFVAPPRDAPEKDDPSEKDVLTARTA